MCHATQVVVVDVAAAEGMAAGSAVAALVVVAAEASVMRVLHLKSLRFLLSFMHVREMQSQSSQMRKSLSLMPLFIFRIRLR